MSDHLIANILKIEAEADNIVKDAKQKAGEITAGIHNEISIIKTNLEDEYRQKLEALKSRMAELQKSEEGRLRVEFESLKKQLLDKSKNLEDAVNWVIKHIYEI